MLGVKQVIFFDEPDGELQPTLGLRKRVVAEIRRHKPDAVIALDPTRYYFGNRYINHADHRASGEVAIDAVYPAARNRMYHPDANEYDPAENVVETAGDLNRWLQEAKHPRTAASRRASKYFSQSPEGRLRFALAMYNGGYATTDFARKVYSPSIMRMVAAGGPEPPVELPGSRRVSPP